VKPELLASWIERYERAWRTPGTELLAELFAPDATYRAAPFDTVLRGIREIAVFWEQEREGPDEQFELAWEPVAREHSTGVARVEVQYAAPPPGCVYRDLWIVTLDDSHRCNAFEEWPFFPGQPRVHQPHGVAPVPNRYKTSSAGRSARRS
jgi:hypothetical protein